MVTGSVHFDISRKPSTAASFPNERTIELSSAPRFILEILHKEDAARRTPRRTEPGRRTPGQAVGTLRVLGNR
jgi:hypothetical protein